MERGVTVYAVADADDDDVVMCNASCRPSYSRTCCVQFFRLSIQYYLSLLLTLTVVA